MISFIIIALNTPIILIKTIVIKSESSNISNNKANKSSVRFISIKYSDVIINKDNKNENQELNNKKDGWTTANVNIRKTASIYGEILEVLPFNTHIIYSFYNEEWIKIQFSITKGRDKTIMSGYINSAYISNKECSYVEYTITSNNGFKSFMDYKTITSKETRQYKLQNNYTYTGNYGIRQVNGRYCIAVGTAFNAQVGDYIDLLLENSTVIPCIIGDIKADKHTNDDNITTTANGCVSEFIVDDSVLSKEIKLSGDISLCLKEWDSKVTVIRLYNKNVFL